MTDAAQTKPKHVMMMAAGTGGHVFPALAVAKELQQQGIHVSWLATPTGMENRLLQNQNIPIYQICHLTSLTSDAAEEIYNIAVT